MPRKIATLDRHIAEFTWNKAVELMKLHILHTLCTKYKCDVNTSVRLVRNATERFDPLIDSIMKQWIKDTPFPGIPCGYIDGRNGEGDIVYIIERDGEICMVKEHEVT